MTLKAPFPYFGGKSKVMPVVWKRLGNAVNFVDPFCGSCASILGRPLPFHGCETVNDLNPMIGNFWRCIQRDPLRLALETDKPVEESWLHAAGDAIFYGDDWYAARGLGSRAEFAKRLDTYLDFCHYEIAGIWCAGLCQWIGDNWGYQSHNAKHDADGNAVAGMGVNRKRPHLGNAGRGVNRQLPHLFRGQGVNRQLPHLGDAGRGVNRKLPHLGDAGKAYIESLSFGPGLVELLSAWPAVTSRTWMFVEYFCQLAERMRMVRVCAGDWKRVLSETPTVKLGLTAVFLDPPYSAEGRDAVYGEHEDFDVANDVRAWCIEHGDNPLLRICLCGYGEHDELAEHGWDCVRWKTGGGYANQNSRGVNNASRECLWFSPHCVNPRRERQTSLIEDKRQLVAC